MDIDKIRIFLSVIDTRNFTTTANEFGYSQSAISQSIKKLEQMLKLPLLIRDNKNIYPTSAALDLLPDMQRLANDETILLEHSSLLTNSLSGTVNIGSFTSISAHYLPPILKSFQDKYPLITLNVMDSTYWDIPEQLNSGTLDIGFVLYPAAQGLECKELFTDRYMAVLPKEHELAQFDTVPLSALFQHPFIIPADNFHSEIGNWIKENNITVAPLLTAQDDYITVSMVRSSDGIGVSILPQLVLKDFLDIIDIRPISPPITRTLGIAAHSFHTLSPCCKKFLDYCLSFPFSTLPEGSTM